MTTVVGTPINGTVVRAAALEVAGLGSNPRGDSARGRTLVMHACSDA